MASGLIGSDAYSTAFHWLAPREREGSAAEVARLVAAEVEAEYPNIDWRRTAATIRRNATAGGSPTTES